VARLRYMLESACAIACAVLAVLTLAVKDWIEVVFRMNPDRGSGFTEVAIVVTLAVTSVISAADALRLRRLERARA
jgi:hypothetical protein